jgi:ATP-dependent DNA helicase RecG
VKAPRTKAELLESAGLANAYLNYKRHIQPLLQSGLLEMTLPDKPNSRLQKYRLTPRGRTILSPDS